MSDTLEAKVAALTALSLVHEENAKERYLRNSEGIKMLFDKMDSLDCKTHTAKVEALENSCKALWGTLSGVLVVCLIFGVYLKMITEAPLREMYKIAAQVEAKANKGLKFLGE